MLKRDISGKWWPLVSLGQLLEKMHGAELVTEYQQLSRRNKTEGGKKNGTKKTL